MGYEISSLPVLFATPPPEYAYKKPLCRPERKQNPNAGVVGGGGREEDLWPMLSGYDYWH